MSTSAANLASRYLASTAAQRRAGKQDLTRTEVKDLIDTFLYRNRSLARMWSDPEESVGMCDDASDALIYWLQRQGYDADYAHERRRTPGLCSTHTVVEVGGWTVDLTARQYDPNADFPEIY